MKATVKHLPAEGDRKEGVFVRNEDGIVWEINSEDAALTMRDDVCTLKYADDHDLPVVKPFAVTQDIEPNEEVWDAILKEYCELEKSTIDTYKGMKSNRFFKTLGELSPEAIWVKDGETIKGRLVEYCKIHNFDDPLCSCHEKKNGNGYLLFEVECPTCNTHH